MDGGTNYTELDTSRNVTLALSNTYGTRTALDARAASGDPTISALNEGFGAIVVAQNLGPGLAIDAISGVGATGSATRAHVVETGDASDVVG
jgi:hypothetical protein